MHVAKLQIYVTIYKTSETYKHVTITKQVNDEHI